VLVVAINSDESVRRLKGPARPLMVAEDRAEVLASLECVDYVTFFDEDDPVQIIRELRPDIQVKGGDYDAASMPETAVVEAYGGRVVIVPLLEGRSTSDLLRRIKAMD
jgi:rfaE bifunctional protein nucleotidyltransferase chain/domain